MGDVKIFCYTSMITKMVLNAWFGKLIEESMEQEKFHFCWTTMIPVGILTQMHVIDTRGKEVSFARKFNFYVENHINHKNMGIMDRNLE